MGEPGKTITERFVFVDALRGIAAIIVLFFHLFQNPGMVLVEAVAKALPPLVLELVAYGYYGVHIFFVLSGFVIAHSLRKTPLSFKSVGNFILRRQLRLDPPFWIMIFICVCLLAVEAQIPALQTTAPTLKEVLLNMVYLHKITGVRDIVTVSWTLCIEVQFYLVFILLLILGAMLSSGKTNWFTTEKGDSSTRNEGLSGKDDTAPSAALLIILAVGLYSLFARWSGSEEGSNTNPWFIIYWCYFAGGVLCYWTIRRRFNNWIFFSYLALLWLYGIAKFDTSLLFGAGTLSLLAIAGLRNSLTNWLNIKPLQYFGRISYSLYLVHTVIIDYLYRGASKAFGISPLVGLTCMLAAILLSLGAAHLLHIAVERPSMALAARFRSTEKIQTEISGFAGPDNEEVDMMAKLS